MAKQDEKILPPKWPLGLLKFFIRKEYLEEIEGDMEEIFRENLSIYSKRKAKIKYAFEAMKLLRPILIKRELLKRLKLRNVINKL